MNLDALIADLRALTAAVTARDLSGGLIAAGKLMTTAGQLLAKFHPTMMSATPQAKAELTAAVAELETCCTSPALTSATPAGADKFLDPERLANLLSLVKFVLSLFA